MMCEAKTSTCHHDLAKQKRKEGIVEGGGGLSGELIFKVSVPTVIVQICIIIEL